MRVTRAIEKMVNLFFSHPASKLARLCLCLSLGVVAAPLSTRAASEKVIYKFKRSAGSPDAGLVQLGGKLYGTTSSVVSSATIYQVTPDGKVRTIGVLPGSNGIASALLAVGRLMYGVMETGGDYRCNCGYVFSANEKGEITILHAFTGVEDGAAPVGGLIELDGTLYGATTRGGKGKCDYIEMPGCGTVFGITPEGTYTQIYAFKGSKAGDGEEPLGPLVAVQGLLYGTTFLGGSVKAQGGVSGTLFSLATDGAETTLHSFGKTGSDGSGPNGGLLLLGNTLYGTTKYGGLGVSAEGIVYSIALALDGAHEKILHTFNYPQNADGVVPDSELIAVNAKLYGTTQAGGSTNDGTLYSLDYNGNETVVYSFQGDDKDLGIDDAAIPNSGLLYIDGSFYGTSVGGGRRSRRCPYRSCGTIFEVTP